MTKQQERFENKLKMLAEVQLLITQRPYRNEWQAGINLLLIRYFPNAKDDFKEEFFCLANCMQNIYFSDIVLTSLIREYKSEDEELLAKMRKQRDKYAEAISQLKNKI